MIEDNHKLAIQYDELKKRYRTMEGKNGVLQFKLRKARKNLKRLRLERSLLLDRIDRNHHRGGADSDRSDSELELLLYDDDLHPTFHHKQGCSTDKHMTAKPPKKKKDPNAPKGPGNVFFLFCRMERDKIKGENPQENISEVTKLLGLKWKGLLKEEKQVYYDTFKKEMEEYEEAMKSYKNGITETDTNQSLDEMAESTPSLSYGNQQVELTAQKHPQEVDLKREDVHLSIVYQEQKEGYHLPLHNSNSLPLITSEKQNAYMCN
ncbi:HMG-box [Backusella circina FSU 941]|nr:HMG-box [Backusella circina FSU 941]